MQFSWLNKQNNNKLIIFFTGWSFDYKPFEFLACDSYDVLMLYDYNDFDLPEIPTYNEYYLVSWSMGVYVAYQLRDKLPKFTKKIAINGTPFPVDNEFGIPEKTFILTLRHAKIGLQEKFYQNIFYNSQEFERYKSNPVERTIENREEELKKLYDKIKLTEKIYEPYYNKAFVSSYDKIIPTKNQINFWQDKAEIIDSGHFPYYNFKSWNEILCK